MKWKAEGGAVVEHLHNVHKNSEIPRIHFETCMSFLCWVLIYLFILFCYFQSRGETSLCHEAVIG